MRLKGPEMGNKDFELKALVIFIVVAVALIVFFTRVHQKKRPIAILIVFMSYILFQCIHMIEFFPMTAFQMFSYPEEPENAIYVRLVGVKADGTRVEAQPHQVLPMMADGRMRRYIPEAIESQEVKNQLTLAYAKGYEKRIRKPGGPKIKEVLFQEWEWNLSENPRDEKHGSIKRQAVGRVRELDLY